MSECGHAEGQPKLKDNLDARDIGLYICIRCLIASAFRLDKNWWTRAGAAYAPGAGGGHMEQLLDLAFQDRQRAGKYALLGKKLRADGGRPRLMLARVGVGNASAPSKQFFAKVADAMNLLRRYLGELADATTCEAGRREQVARVLGVADAAAGLRSDAVVIGTWQGTAGGEARANVLSFLAQQEGLSRKTLLTDVFAEEVSKVSGGAKVKKQFAELVYKIAAEIRHSTCHEWQTEVLDDCTDGEIKSAVCATETWLSDQDSSSQAAARVLVRDLVHGDGKALRVTMLHCVKYHMHSAASRFRKVDVSANASHADTLFRLIAGTLPEPGKGYPTKEMVKELCEELNVHLELAELPQLEDHLQYRLDRLVSSAASAFDRLDTSDIFNAMAWAAFSAAGEGSGGSETQEKFVKAVTLRIPQLFGGAKGSNILSHCVVKLAMLVAIVSVDKYQRGQAPSAVTAMEQDIRSLLPATALALQPITGQRMNAAETLTLLRERFVPSLVEYIRSRDVQMNNYDPDDWETPFDEGLNFLHAGAASFNDPALTASLLQSPPLQELVRGLGYVIPTDDHARDQELGNAAARIHCSLYSLWRPLAQRLQDDELYPAVNFNLPPCQWLIDSQRELQFEQIARALATLSDSDGLLAGFVSHASQQSLATHLVYNVYCNSLLASLTEAYLGTSTQKSFHEHVRRLSSVHCGGPVSPGLFLDTDTARLGRVALAEAILDIHRTDPQFAILARPVQQVLQKAVRAGASDPAECLLLVLVIQPVDNPAADRRSQGLTTRARGLLRRQSVMVVANTAHQRGTVATVLYALVHDPLVGDKALVQSASDNMNETLDFLRIGEDQILAVSVLGILVETFGLTAAPSSYLSVFSNLLPTPPGVVQNAPTIKELGLCRAPQGPPSFYVSRLDTGKLQLPWPRYKRTAVGAPPQVCMATLTNVLANDTGVFSYLHSLKLHPKYTLSAMCFRHEEVLFVCLAVCVQTLAPSPLNQSKLNPLPPSCPACCPVLPLTLATCQVNLFGVRSVSNNRHFARRAVGGPLESIRSPIWKPHKVGQHAHAVRGFLSAKLDPA
eukprot:Tamp_03603.p1 GENE.Tamp_03603~~Tamp_03603.p1  ORF type:complete len:1186 (+),score=147.25 Tamp_03603:351-3560(+)